MHQWGADRVEQLAELVAAAAPGEDLSADELLTTCLERPGVVLAAPDGSGAVAVGVGERGGEVVAEVRLLVVHPADRGAGLGSSLLERAEAWAADRGATRIELGGALPLPLWPGVAPGSGVASLAAARGYERREVRQALVVGPSFRAAAPAGVEVRRAVSDIDVVAVTTVVRSRWPQWADEVARALEHGTCHVARVASGAQGADAVVGIGCHSVVRAGWVGPLVVVTTQRRRGTGHALLGQICRDLMIAELPAAYVPGVAEPGVAAFLEAAGATVVERHERWVKPLSR